ncbi:hypothetical protein J6590_068937, partial [Homalodisca vitripennis]
MNNRIDIADPRPYTNVEIYGRNFKALVDTGAVASLINEEVADFLGKVGVLPARKQFKISLADNTQVSVSSIYRFKCRITDHELDVATAYLPSLTATIILGMDLIRPLNLVSVNCGGDLYDSRLTDVSCMNSDRVPEE